MIGLVIFSALLFGIVMAHVVRDIPSAICVAVVLVVVYIVDVIREARKGRNDG